MSQRYEVHTPENVALGYHLAGIGSRFLAAFVDLLIQMVAILLLVLAVVALAHWTAGTGLGEALSALGAEAAAVWLVAIVVLAIFLLLFGYYVAFELLWHGQTPGKRLFRLRVLRDSGYPVGPLESLIRNFVRIVDFLPTSYGIGVVVMLIDGRSRRLGDIAAGTIVVKEQRQLRPADLQGPVLAPAVAEVAPAPALIERLSGEQYSLLREYLLRREQLAAPARASLAHELASGLAARLDLPAPASAAEADALIERLAAAYRARHAPR